PDICTLSLHDALPILRNMLKKACLLWLMVTAVHVMAQSLSGEIMMRDTSSLYLNQIYVTNVNEQRSILSDVNGNFTIAAKPGDIDRKSTRLNSSHVKI